MGGGGGGGGEERRGGVERRKGWVGPARGGGGGERKGRPGGVGVGGRGERRGPVRGPAGGLSSPPSIKPVGWPRDLKKLKFGPARPFDRQRAYRPGPNRATGLTCSGRPGPLEMPRYTPNMYRYKLAQNDQNLTCTGTCSGCTSTCHRKLPKICIFTHFSCTFFHRSLLLHPSSETNMKSL